MMCSVNSQRVDCNVAEEIIVCVIVINNHLNLADSFSLLSKLVDQVCYLILNHLVLLIFVCYLILNHLVVTK